MTDHHHHDADDPSLSDLVSAVRDVATQARDLTEHVTHETQERRRNHVWFGFGLVAIGVFSVLQLAGLYEAREGRDRLMDCTTPGGDCFEQSQDRTGTIVTQIICANNDNTRLVLSAALPDAELPPMPATCSERENP